MLLIEITVSVLGLFLGSFIHTSHYRLKNSLSLMPRSNCDHCHKPIPVLFLLPILGYLMTGGKCRNCRYRIPIGYPLFELANAVFVWAIFRFSPGLTDGLFNIFIWESVLLIGVLDLSTMYIYPQPVLAGFLLRLAAIIFGIGPDLKDSLLGMMIGAGVFHFMGYFYQALRKKEGLGEGDATLMGLLGFILGWQALYGVILFGSLAGIIFVLASGLIRRKKLNDAIPFAPALIIGAMLEFFLPSLSRNLMDAISAFY